MASRILAIVTSVTDLPDGNPTGFWLQELAAPYCSWRDQGIDVDIASPAGGPVQPDPLSCDDPWLLDEGERFLGDDIAMAKLGSSIAVKDVSVEKYDAIFLVGGVGAAFDFYPNSDLTALITEFYRSQKLISAICTGSIALSDVMDSAGGKMIAGRAITGISNAENQQFHDQPILPVLTETALREAGAQFVKAPPWEACVQMSGRVVTGQNPASAPELAREVSNGI
ncbi:type 1 glutamine amidotransferase domain-containing protein [Erythrobacter sp.]|uniref:type 1 glutamine amidotransferase domain-containing protein n=1 Tax=Erythrobacter sp. TaxID=1042 RepID=UPI001B10E94C|nr:type 1 glutamine amidotransferase domain-containing protein [Erythrobacter sp.]MBO6527544.1 type 1 glutamine amidotransferase domain-containing protein [Erythrobacter sp.]MBO6530224.1 type 1 glutamine amidotransferase domain-containing protein [Erythrobacter sp.]